MFEIVFVVLIILAILIVLKGRRQFSTPKTTSSNERTYRNFEAAPSIFASRAEMSFFHTLRKRLPVDFILLTKVRLEDIIQVKKSIQNPERKWKLRARVKSRHVDFIVIDPAGTCVIGIELDGPSHDDPDNFNADSLKNGVFKAAGIPLLRVSVSDEFGAKADEVVSLIS